MADLVTFGESMLRLSTPEGERLARVDGLDVHVGGAESNVAVAAHHLGLDATWLSKLPDTDLGRRIAHEIRSEGVDAAVTWTDEGRAGTYYLERGPKPRGANVLYDREDAAIRTAMPDELPLERVREAHTFFTSGITPALSGDLGKTTASLLSTAREAGATTVLDANYRSKLWDPDQARATLTSLFSDVDVLFVAERDAERVLDATGDAAVVAADLRDRYGFETVVLTRGDAGALAVHGDETYEQDVFEADTVDPVGTGDAFVGGYLASRLQDGSVPDALAYGAATASLKRTLAGDHAVVSPPEVEAVLDAETGDISR
ncbi:MAG: bifunctional 2-dehydro-3-deoxygluconokinase/2-dehydro-3-deoxygalactonokinase [Haloarculaceae archaeon]